MIGLTLRHLRYLDALARHGHFGRAAEACSITQPALSQQIKELEGMLGTPLVERAARRVRMTPLGEAFVERARTILLAVDELEDLVRAASGPLSGRLRLGVIPTVAPYFLPAVIRTLSARLPEIDLDLREALTRTLIRDLLEANLDAAILALPISEPALHEFPLFDEDFVLVRPAADADRPVPSPDTLAAMRLLLLEEGHCFRDQALSFCKVGDARPRQMMEGSSLSTLVQLVGAGVGVTLLPEMALPLEARASDVSVARFPEPAPRRSIGLAWRRRNPLADQLMEIGAILRDAGPSDRA